MRCIVLAGLCAAALAGHDPEWVAEVRALWKQVQSVPLGDATDTRKQYGNYVKSHEKGKYKVEYSDGRVEFTDTAPRHSASVWAVWMKRPANTQFYTVGRTTKYYTHLWVRANWIAEKGRWETGPAKANRAKSDDANWRAWLKKVGYGPHMKGARMSSWNSAHRYLIRDLSSLETARERLRKHVDGEYKVVPSGRAAAIKRERERVSRRESAYKTGLDKMKQGLLVAGKNLGVGDAMWRCEEATLALYTATNAERRAEAEFKMWSYRAKRKPDAKLETESAKRKWERAGYQVNRLRRARRTAMADVMRGIR